MFEGYFDPISRSVNKSNNNTSTMLQFNLSSRFFYLLGLAITVSVLTALLGGWDIDAPASIDEFSFLPTFGEDAIEKVSSQSRAMRSQFPSSTRQGGAKLNGDKNSDSHCQYDPDWYATLDGRTPKRDDFDVWGFGLRGPDENVKNIEIGFGADVRILSHCYSCGIGREGSFSIEIKEYREDGSIKKTKVFEGEHFFGEGGINKRYEYGETSGAELDILMSGSSASGPGKPQNLIVERLDESVEVQWQEPSGDGTVSSYSVYRSESKIESTDDESVSKIATTDGDETTTNVDHPDNPDVIHFYAVKAFSNPEGRTCGGLLSDNVSGINLIKSIAELAVVGETFKITYGPLTDDDESNDPTIEGTTVEVGDEEVDVDSFLGGFIVAEIPPLFEPGEYHVTVESNGVASTSDKKMNVVPDAGGGPISFSASSSIPSGTGTSASFSNSLTTTAEPEAEDVRALDVDNDESQDVISVHPSSGNISWYKNQNGKGQFTDANVISGDMTGTDQVVTTDLSGNGHPDVLAAASDSLVWFENIGGSYSSDITITENVGNVSSIATQDIDRDGLPDVIAADATSGTVVWYDNKGEKYFTVGDTIVTGMEGVASLAPMDADQDGNIDILLAAQGSNTISWYENTGDGSYSGETVITSSANGVADIALTDVDGDFDEDLIVASPGNNTVEWYEKTSSGFSSSGHTVSTDVTDVREVVPVDADGDGDPDLVAAARGDNSVVLFENTGEAPVFSSEKNIVTQDAVGIRDVTAADLDGDFIPDLLSAQGEDPALTFFRGHRFVNADTTAVDSDGPVNFGEVGVRITLSGTSGSGEVTAKKFASGPTGKAGIAESNVSEYRFVINTSDDLTVGSDTEIRFDVGTLGGITAPSNVDIYQRTIVDSGEFTALEASHDSEENELVATTSSLGEFVMASNSEPLPVEFAEFSGTLVGDDQVRLRWKTASEQSNAGFAVERRRGEESARPWKEVGFIESKASGGTSSNPISYQFDDSELPGGADVLTYRLRQVDTDGSTSYSKEVTVRRGVEKTSLGVYPNPVRNRATVRLAVPRKKRVQVALFDVLGRKVRTVVDGPQEGRRTVRVDVSDLPSGTYFLRMKAGEKTLSRKLTVVQ